ncbi:N-acetyltransferase family protein [Actinomycetospora sp. C-140]
MSSAPLAALSAVIREPDTIRPVYGAARRRLHSDVEAYGLRRDLSVPHTPPAAKITVSVRPMEDRDVAAVLEATAQLSPDEKWDRATRRRLLEARIGRPHVAVTEDDEACYTQWLFTSADNDDIARHFEGIFPRLDDDTALLEGAFTPVAWRGKGVMSAAMSRIAEKAGPLGARYVITFVGTDNPASLRGCEKANFFPYLRRTQKFRMGRQRVDFELLENGAVGAGG